MIVIKKFMCGAHSFMGITVISAIYSVMQTDLQDSLLLLLAKKKSLNDLTLAISFCALEPLVGSQI